MDILIVDDEKSIRLTTSLALEAEGHYVERRRERNRRAETHQGGELRLWSSSICGLGEEDGMEVLQKIMALNPQPLVVIFTAHASIATAVQATQLGAFDYLEKPFTPDQLRAILVKAQKARRTQGEVAHLKKTVHELKTEVRHFSPPVAIPLEDAKTKMNSTCCSAPQPPPHRS